MTFTGTALDLDRHGLEREEVERLHAEGIGWERLDYYGLEYRYVGAYLRGEINRNDLFQRLNSAIHDFAKRQETWFRKAPSVEWFEVESAEQLPGIAQAVASSSYTEVRFCV